MLHMDNFLSDREQCSTLYRYGVYRHRITAPDGSVCVRPFIVIRNQYGVIVRFTNLHNFAEIYAGKTVMPISADAEKKLYYICKALNYILIEHRSVFGIESVFGVTAEALAQFFRDYAETPMPNGKYRSAQSVGKCVSALAGFFMKLCRKYSARVVLILSSLLDTFFTNSCRC